MEVKLVARTLDLFELFARELRPLSLTELSRGLDVPMSSTLALVRTLAAKGYLYETRKRGYYPTKKMLGAAAAIDAADPVLDMVRPCLVALRDATGETVVLGKRQEHQVVYLDTVQSLQPIRYTATAGEVRALYSNSIGKALFSALPPDERQALAARLDYRSQTPHTLANAPALLLDADAASRRGWAANISESVADLAAVAVPFCLASEWYAISVVGPLDRMRAGWENHLAALNRAIAELQASMRVIPVQEQ